MSQGTKRYAYLALASICIMQVIWVGIGWNSLSLYAAPITEEWGISRAAFMLTITLVAACNTIVSMFFYGQLAEKLGLRKLIIVGGVLCTAGLAVFSFAEGIPLLYLAGVLFGTGCALLNNNAVNAVCNAWFQKNTGTYMSIASTFGSVAGIVAATAVAALILVTGWRPSLLVIAAISVVGMVVCFILYKGSPDQLGVAPMGADEAGSQGGAASAAEETGPSYSEMLKTGKFWALAIVMLIVGVVGYAILANIPLLVGDFGFPELSGTALSVALAASAICLIPFGRVLDKLGSRVMIAICFAFLIVAMVIMMIGAVSLPMVYVVAALVGAAYDMCMTAPGIAVMDAFGRKDYAKKMGTLCGFCYAGVALGPTVMNVFFDLGGGSYTTAFIAFIVLAVIGIVAIFPLTNRAKVQ
ncbi:MFS transporter [Adlercreutzia sp. R7]|uniref:MFS transporter n=1 Tax=Adlercreutzia wanghongyangiae TaxID=3111451 RepID=A0ABU6IEH1_9ACTN|nr:MFS transporter [Adlercreutzia sp. R7]